eukprot:NODE_1322_length_2522_cov_15.711900.p1 GENE.NODE_1322_length_2522_cov_15.711900~~NODE_1322_length_2522_cov_15.711900.p1  ORF type:complete len:614 (-),score=114.95 NODE_1322_length_2522_cov_15.711900:267-2108(-)
MLSQWRWSPCPAWCSSRAQTYCASSSAAGRTVCQRTPKAIENSGNSQADIEVLEAHGDGVFIKDATEVRSHLAAYRTGLSGDDETRPLMVGCFKTQLGHSKENSGGLAMLKIIGCLQMGLHAPTIHLRQLNPYIDFSAQMQMSDEVFEIEQTSSFAGLSSNGFGGSSVHLIFYGQRSRTAHNEAEEMPASKPPILYWPAGGGTRTAQIRTGYFISGTWCCWEQPQKMKDEGRGRYSFVITLGENGWEQFHILCDGAASRVMHPDMYKAPKCTPAVGPDRVGRGKTWMIDGRQTPDSNRIEDVASGGDADGPGALYRVIFQVAGEWGVVSWDRVPKGARITAAIAPPSPSLYYVVCSWKNWSFEEMEPQGAEGSGLYRKEVRVLSPDGMFQISRCKDLCQLIHPATHAHAGSTAASQGPAQGPQDGIASLSWGLGGKPGDVFAITLERPPPVDRRPTMPVVTWELVRNEPLTPEETLANRAPEMGIVGSWDGFVYPYAMHYDSQMKCFRFIIELGRRGKERFQILNHGRWDQVIHPTHDDATHGDGHATAGPSSDSRFYWVVGGGSETNTGIRYEVKVALNTNGTGVTAVSCERAMPSPHMDKLLAAGFHKVGF